MSETEVVSRNLCGVVDIGSNGIRFSISSKAAHHARIMPCVFKDRIGISLYEIQFPHEHSHEQIPIPDDIIQDICNAIKRFKLICEDFGVPDESVRVIATEATRIALNKQEFITAIEHASGWKVELLSEELETQVITNALVSSFNTVTSLVLDLSGGSLKISWIRGGKEYCANPVILPYGATTLTKRLKLENNKTELYNEIKSQLKEKMDGFEFPSDLSFPSGEFDLVTRGGSLRGMGHLLLSLDDTYPIQTIINGFRCQFSDFKSITDYLFLRNKIPGNKKLFKVSEKRSRQLPAVSILLTALFDYLPPIKNVYFSEGGIREGLLFTDLTPETQQEDPLLIASRPYAPLLCYKYLDLLLTAIPKQSVPSFVWQRIAPAICNLAFIHASYPKELQPTAALHVATTGIISGCHGISHEARALTGIALCNRWGGNIPPVEEQFREGLQKIILDDTDKNTAKRMIWWTNYIGTIMYVICGVHPGGNIRDGVFDFKVLEPNQHSKSIDETLNEAPPKEFEVIVRINKDELKTSASVRARIITLQKKIKKLSRGSQDKVKIRVQILDHI